MILRVSPPLCTCRLPAPWHDSQPMFFAFSPFACKRACDAVRKSRTISSWQVRHSSLPTNSAPGILGGARIVRFVSNVVQESRMTVSAAVPPIAQNSFSRLTCSHLIGLSRRTALSIGRLAKKRQRVSSEKARRFDADVDDYTNAACVALIHSADNRLAIFRRAF